MFARIKRTRQNEYLQIVENYRDAGKVRQCVVLYVGHYTSIDEALYRMPQERRRLRNEATRRGKENLRHEANAIDRRLEALRQLVAEHPDLLGRDRGRAERYSQQTAKAIAARWEERRGRSAGMGL